MPELALFEIQIPASVAVLSPRRFPPGWDSEPVSRASQDAGAAWLKRKRAAVLRVPSAVVPAEHNFVLDPEHADFARLVISRPERFELDSRLPAR